MRVNMDFFFAKLFLVFIRKEVGEQLYGLSSCFAQPGFDLVLYQVVLVDVIP